MGGYVKLPLMTVKNSTMLNSSTIDTLNNNEKQAPSGTGAWVTTLGNREWHSSKVGVLHSLGVHINTNGNTAAGAVIALKIGNVDTGIEVQLGTGTGYFEDISNRANLGVGSGQDVEWQYRNFDSTVSFDSVVTVLDY